MATTPHTIASARGDAHRLDALLVAAPAAALAAGVAAEWLDFSALRYPLLLVVLIGVVLTAWALFGGRKGWRVLAVTFPLGVFTWAAAQTVYVVLHLVQGERFNFEVFDSQPAQAVGLIIAHGVFLGLPTGFVAGVALWLFARMQRT